MAQPVWVTPAGNLGTIPEGVFYSTPLIAVDSELGDPVYYQLLAGQLPEGMQIQQSGLMVGVPKAQVTIQGVPELVSRDVTSKFAVRAYTQQTTEGITVINRLADRTFEITVSGQDVPQWITPSGQLAQYFDGTLVTDLQVEYTNTDPEDIIVVKLVAGTLPPGLVVSPSGLISGLIQPNAPINATAGFSRDNIGYDTKPYDFTTQSINENFEFVLEVSDGKVGGTSLRTFSIFVWSRSLMTADTTLVTADNTFITADVAPGWVPVILNPQGDIGTVRNDNWFAYKFDAVDFDGNNIQYIISSSSPTPLSTLGLTLDINSGWLYGYIPNLGITNLIYTFGVRAYKVSDPTYISKPYIYNLTVTGPVDTEIFWETPSDLGTIANGSISILYVRAVNKQGIQLQYQLKSGTNSSLPQGLQLLPSGDIAGRVSFNTFALDLGTTTFDLTPIQGVVNPTTFDMTHTFTVVAYSANGVINVDKVFTVKVVRAFNAPYENLYIKAMPPQDDRELINSLLQNSDIFNPDYIYRSQDPNFGVATNVIYQHAFGLTSSTINDYYLALQKNHYWKNLVLGEIKTAQATDASGNVLYEVVYSQIVDDLVNNQGKSVSQEVLLPYPVDVPPLTNYVYPNSLEDMRQQVIDVVGQESNILPLWMQSAQADGRVLGFVPAWVIAYTKPGRAKEIAYYIRQRFNTDLNLVDFEVDRYELDRSATNYWLPATELNISNIVGNGSVVTVTYTNQYSIPFITNEQIVIANVVPSVYNGTYSVLTCSDTTVTLASAVSNTYTSGGTVSSSGTWIPVPPQLNTFDVNYHYNVTSVSSSSGYAVGDIIKILGSQIGGTNTINDVLITVNTVNTSGAILDWFYQGTALITIANQSYLNITGINITGSGTGATWNLSVIPGESTVFDYNSLEFTAPVDMYPNTTDYDKYLVFPKRNILE